MTTTPQRYTDERLHELRYNYLLNCKPTTLKQLDDDGELETHLEFRADLCLKRVDSLMASGIHEGQAWQWAIREILLETEHD